MNPADGSMDEMRANDEFERALAGEAAPSALTTLVDDLRSLTDTVVDESIARRHVAAAASAARAGHEPGLVVMAPSRDPAFRRARMLTRTALAAAACVALVLSLGSAGALPTPVQAAVADIAERVGLHLPDPDRSDGSEAPATDATPPPADESGSGGENEPGTSEGPAAAPPVTPGPPAWIPESPPATPGPTPGTPTGPPASTPSGPPAGTPTGPPEGVPGPPGGTPSP